LARSRLSSGKRFIVSWQAENRHQRVVEIVRNAAGQRTERLELVRVQQLPLEIAVPFLGGA